MSNVGKAVITGELKNFKIDVSNVFKDETKGLNETKFFRPQGYATLQDVTIEGPQYIPTSSKGNKMNNLTLDSKIFVASPLSGNLKANLKLAADFCSFVANQGYNAYAPHILYTAYLDELVQADREKGIKYGKQELPSCSELWAFGSKVSSGMQEEIMEALELGKPVRLLVGLNLSELDYIPAPINRDLPAVRVYR